MSQRLPASRPASWSPEGAAITLPPVQIGNNYRPQDGRLAERLQLNMDDRRPQQTPPLNAHLPHPREDWRPAPSRDLGVLSMLNPIEPESSTLFGRRPVTLTASPLSAIETRPTFGASPAIAPRHSSHGQQTPVDGYTANFTRPRSILTPRSPSRAFSSGRFDHSTTDAQQSPFLGGRRTTSSYIAEPGQFASSNVPPLPTPPAGSEQLRYSFPPIAAATSLEPRTFSTGDTKASTRAGLFQSMSPSITASSHNPTSPAQFPHNQSSPPFQPTPRYYPGSSFAAAMQVGSGGMSMQSMVPSEGVGVGEDGVGGGPYNNPIPQTRSISSQSSSADSSRKTSASDPIQSLTFSGPEGSYQVPVDFHQASRSAGEKRARNAGASARFRKRKKEEKAQKNVVIEGLQQQARELHGRLRDIEQERDFYKSEHDRLHDLLGGREPDTRHLAQGPLSPQATRQLPGPAAVGGNQMGGPPALQTPSSAGSQNSAQEGQSPRRGRTAGIGSGPGRSARRRTGTRGDFNSLPYPHLLSSTPPTVQAGFVTGPVGQVLPPRRTDNPNAQQNSNTVPSPSPSTTAQPPPPSLGNPYPGWPFPRSFPGDNDRRS